MNRALHRLHVFSLKQRARALVALMRALRLTLGFLLCSQEALSLRVPPPRSQAGQHVSRRRWLAGAGAAAAASAVPALAAPVLTRTREPPYRTVRTSLLCAVRTRGTGQLAPRRHALYTRLRVKPRVCVTTGQRCAVVRLLVARPGAGRGGAGALDRPARRHQLEDRRVGVRRQQPCRGLPRRWV